MFHRICLLFILLILVGAEPPLCSGCPKKLYLILRLNFGAVQFLMRKVIVLPDFKTCTNHLVPKVLALMRQ